MKLYAPSTIREIKDKYDFKLSKSLGQNFLTDYNIIEKIINATNIQKEDLVIEIGPGIGVLTGEAAKRAAKVIAIEIDSSLMPILEETLKEFDNIQVINKDILKTDLNDLVEQNSLIEGQKIKEVKIIGNLPYYITTPIIMKVLEEGVNASSITIMMQKEVAERLMAKPGTKAYGAITVAVQYFCEIEMVAKVPKDVFIPPPKVDSAVLKLIIRKNKPIYLEDEKIFFKCVKAGFGQRRKTLINSLLGGLDVNKSQIEEALKSVGIDGQRRAETLSLEEFGQIANSIKRIK